MDWLNVNESSFYAVVLLFSFGSSLVVTLNSSRIKSVSQCFGVASVSGFLGFSIVTFLISRSGEPPSDHWYYLGIASTVGLTARYQDLIIRVVLTEALKKFGIDPKLIEPDNLADDDETSGECRITDEDSG